MTDTPHNVPVKLSALTENTAPVVTDTILMVDDPGGGTPATNKLKFLNLTKALRWEDSVNLNLGTADDATLDYDGTNLVINPKAVGSGLLLVEGDVQLKTDSDKMWFGTGKDASIYYDGSDMFINPKAVGSGDLHILGDITLESDNRAIHFGAAKDYKISWNGSALRFDALSSGAVRFSHEVNAVAGFKDAGVSGIDGTFAWDDAGGLGATNTVTVGGGIITAWTQV